MEATRVDRWLWAVRICKTRSEATKLCVGGHVRVNGTGAKAATAVHVGDRVTALVSGRERVLDVRQVIDKRVGAPVAAECLVDLSPPPAPREVVSAGLVRDPASGRPTKRERRQLDRFRGR